MPSFRSGSAAFRATKASSISRAVGPGARSKDTRGSACRALPAVEAWPITVKPVLLVAPMMPSDGDDGPERTLVATVRRLKDNPKPLDVFASGKGGVRMLWRRGARVVVGLGAVAHLYAVGPTRLHLVKQQAQTLVAALDRKAGVGVPPTGGPYFVGGFAFRDSLPAEPWSGWPAAWFVLPKRMVVWAEDGTYESTIDGTLPAGAHPEFPPLPPAALAANPPLDEAKWNRGVERVMLSIAAGQVDKVVLARASAGPGSDPDQALAALWAHTSTAAAAASPPTLYAIDRGQGPVWLGATPETLCRLAGTRVESHAVAGSAKDAAGLASEKVKAEHEVVVDEIRLRLGDQLAVRLEKREPSRALAAGTMVHLETPVRGNLARGAHVLDIAGALHPTPAVDGHPRPACGRLRDRIEPSERGWYSGGVGWFDAIGQGEVSVALRGALVRPQESVLYAGAGIVKGSIAKAEWDETERKLQPMRDALAEAVARGAVKA